MERERRGRVVVVVEVSFRAFLESRANVAIDDVVEGEGEKRKRG